MRTQTEILDRFNAAEDLLGTQRSDLICFLLWSKAKPFLPSAYVESVDAGNQKWNQLKKAEERIKDYMPKAYEFAYEKKGMAAARTVLHMKTWLWLCNEKLYAELLPLIDNYDKYGLPLLNKLSEHYKLEIPEDPYAKEKEKA